MRADLEAENTDAAWTPANSIVDPPPRPRQSRYYRPLRFAQPSVAQIRNHDAAQSDREAVHAQMLAQQLRYWTSIYTALPYIKRHDRLDDFLPAFRYGVLSSLRYPNQVFTQVEIELARDWLAACNESGLQWTRARLAVLDAWIQTRECGRRQGAQQPFSIR